MSERINIYCDESCHLENDSQSIMAFGAIWCPQEKVREATQRLREIKERHQLPRDFEIKWGKVSPQKLVFYKDILDYFFDDDDLHFRVVVVSDKSLLNHAAYKQDHDAFYYKMYFQLLSQLLRPDAVFYIYLDIKDTRSASKVAKLKEVLCNSHLDFQPDIIERIQNVRSHEVGLVQLADLLTGAVGYANRGLDSETRPDASPAKRALVRRMRERSNKKLTSSTLLGETKVNILCWHSKQVVP